jgi:hypothetical protein
MGSSDFLIGVVVGIAINLASAYLKPWIDSVGGKISRSWATWNEKHARERSARIEALRQNEAARQIMMFTILHNHMIDAQLLVFSVLFLALAIFTSVRKGTTPAQFDRILNIVGGALFLILLSLAVSAHAKTMRLWHELREALTPKADAPQP